VTALVVALGAGVGTGVRFAASGRWPGVRSTFAVNVAGSLLLGLLLDAPGSVGPFALGFGGGVTTFSTFAVEAVEARRWRYVVLTTAACVAVAGVGLGVGCLLWQ
jgi:CrcB protein